MELSQLLLVGIANGCIHGLVVLGFVLIYKAIEAVNVVQPDMTMLGAFLTLNSSVRMRMDCRLWFVWPWRLSLRGGVR